MLTDAEKQRLSPQDLLAAERREQRLADWRAQDEEDYNHFCAASSLLEREPETTSVKGRILNNRTQQRGHSVQYSMPFFEAVLAGGSGFGLQQIMENCTTLMSMFRAAQSPDAPRPQDPRLATTDDYEFDVVRVSPETQKILEAEASVLNTRLLGLASITDADARLVEQENIEKLAAQYDMVQHPKTNIYVHNIVRVMALEMQYNPGAEAKLCTAAVCVFRLRAQGVDSLGVRSKVGDVYNNDAAEVIVTGQHLPPQFKHS